MIEAIPAEGYCFIGWSGEDTISQDENPLELYRARNLELTAVFAPECVEYASHDGTLQISIPYGTYALDNNEAPVTKIGFTIQDNPPQTDGAEVVGHAYRLDPPGATFSPAVTMTWSFDPIDIPSGVAPADLTIAYYDESHNQWVSLDSEIETGTNTISAPIDHLSLYAVLAPTQAPPPEAIFSLSPLGIRTAASAFGETAKSVTVRPNEKVYIDVLVKNNTDISGKSTLTLEINGKAEEHHQVTLGPGGFSTVTFETSRTDGGTYSVAVSGLDDEVSFIVIGPPPEPAAASLAPVGPDTPAPTPAPAPVASGGAKAKVLAPILVAIFLAVFIPIKLKLRRNRDWY